LANLRPRGIRPDTTRTADRRSLFLHLSLFKPQTCSSQARDRRSRPSRSTFTEMGVRMTTPLTPAVDELQASRQAPTPFFHRAVVGAWSIGAPKSVHS